MKNTRHWVHSENIADIVDPSKRRLAKSAGFILFAGALGLRLTDTLAENAEVAGDTSAERWGDSATLVSAIAAGTLCVPSVAETVAAYTQGFGYEELWRGTVTRDVAEFWGTPVMAGRRAAVVGPPGYRSGLIRIVELGEYFQRLDFHESLGWVALEIRVRSPDAVLSQLEGLPFEHTGGPGDSSTEGDAPSYRAAQFKGPAGEPLYFTQHSQLDRLLELGPNNVGPLFIQTLAARQYRQTRDFYQETLAMRSRMEIGVSRQKLLRKFELPQRDFKMAAVRLPEFCSIQIDEYPAAVAPRPRTEGCLVPGAAMCSFTTGNLDRVATALRQAGLSFTTSERYSMPPAYGRRAIVCRGYTGEMIEFLEV